MLIIQGETSSMPVRSQFSNYLITKFVFRSSGDLNFVILVEDSDTGVPSSIIVRMEYLFVFNSHIVNFV